MMTGRPQLRSINQTVQLFVDDRPMLLLAGELRNSSATSLSELETALCRLKALHLNCAVAPVYWELLEPQEGVFDFTLVKGIVDIARRLELKIVFLWFGTWKNGKSCYVPEWIKTNLERFPRTQIPLGVNSSILSTFGDAIGACDAEAFANLMKFMSDYDRERKTVVMTQIENEVGILGGPRDFSVLAEEAFLDSVPQTLVDYLQTNEQSLLPVLKNAWSGSGRLTEGTWSDFFGDDADEIFMAWHIAEHIEKVAIAGKKQYDIPMYVNAWLKQDHCPRPGQYPSGGPISDMLDIYRAAAPHIDFIAPDIYTPRFKETCQAYTQKNNPLFIPETYFADNRSAASAFYAFAQHDAIGISPFAIDDLAADHPIRESYELLEVLSDLVLKCQASNSCAGFYQQSETDHSISIIGDIKIHVKSKYPLSDTKIPGGGMVLALDDDEFLVVGRNYTVEFSTVESDRANIELLRVDEQRIQNRKLVMAKRLNGDETAHGQSVILPLDLSIRRIKINRSSIPIVHQAEWIFPV